VIRKFERNLCFPYASETKNRCFLAVAINEKLLFKLIELLAATDEVPIPREWDIVEWTTRLFTKSAVAMQKPNEVRTSYLLRRVLRVFADIWLDLMQ
jgi:hypothetical protein